MVQRRFMVFLVVRKVGFPQPRIPVPTVAWNWVLEFRCSRWRGSEVYSPTVRKEEGK